MGELQTKLCGIWCRFLNCLRDFKFVSIFLCIVFFFSAVYSIHSWCIENTIGDYILSFFEQPICDHFHTSESLLLAASLMMGCDRLWIVDLKQFIFGNSIGQKCNLRTFWNKFSSKFVLTKKKNGDEEYPRRRRENNHIFSSLVKHSIVSILSNRNLFIWHAVNVIVIMSVVFHNPHIRSCVSH